MDTLEYTFAQLRQIWIRNGGPVEQADNGAAVAVAESAGNPLSRNPERGTYHNGTYDSGLWQINGTHDLYDVDANARRAIAMWQDRGWEPWCTAWTDGACGTDGGHSSSRTQLIAGSPAANALHKHTGTQSQPTQPPTDEWTGALVDNLPTLKNGSSGVYVGRLQGLLVAAGHDVHVDRAFGTQTEDSVRAVQRRNGLHEDGIVGKATWTALLEGHVG